MVKSSPGGPQRGRPRAVGPKNRDLGSFLLYLRGLGGPRGPEHEGTSLYGSLYLRAGSQGGGSPRTWAHR